MELEHKLLHLIELYRSKGAARTACCASVPCFVHPASPPSLSQLEQIQWFVWQSRIYTVACAPAVTGSFFMPRFRDSVGLSEDDSTLQCTLSLMQGPQPGIVQLLSFVRLISKMMPGNWSILCQTYPHTNTNTNPYAQSHTHTHTQSRTSVAIRSAQCGPAVLFFLDLQGR